MSAAKHAAPSEDPKKIPVLALALIVALLVLLLSVWGYMRTASQENTNNAAPFDPLSLLMSITDKGIRFDSTDLARDDSTSGIRIGASGQDFAKAGFTYGDSVDVTFDSGLTLTDVPYFTGMYATSGMAVLQNASAEENLILRRNGNPALCDEVNWEQTTKVTITLNTAGKYLDHQNVATLSYTNNRSDYPSDEVFANFRSSYGGDLRKGVVYRSVSPCTNYINRSKQANDLAEQAGVKYVINLSLAESKGWDLIEFNGYQKSYYAKLMSNKKVGFVPLDFSFTSTSFNTKLAQGLFDLAREDGPYLVHCEEGKDRTGFTCILLLALCHASVEEITADYMETYKNFYGVTTDDPRYQSIVNLRLNPYLEHLGKLAGKESGYSSEDLTAGARAYLSVGGLADDQIDFIQQRLMGA